MTFVVFSLPRSRSAWLSAFLGAPGRVVGHDIGVTSTSPDHFAWRLKNELAGSCETGAAFAAPLIRRLIPDAVFATVRRPVEEVCASLARFGLTGLEDEMQSRDKALDDIEAANPDALRIEFKDLIKATACDHIHLHCTGLPMDGAWWAAMDPLNIQVDMARQIALITRNAVQIEELKWQARRMMAHV